MQKGMVTLTISVYV